ncbi:MAG: metal ABC transporter permease, partial [bacterium]|nr:metal ABC transporter permease [bacterium]MDW8164877.1 metal ABC transporter permease [Candidatus Omnitrophota bacterium]
LIKYSFFQNSIISCILSGVLAGIIGVWIVVMKVPFIGVALSHACFAGALLGILLNKSIKLFSTLFTFLTSTILGPFSDKAKLHPEISIGIIFSLTLGLAFLFLGLIPESKSQALNFMWGSILTIEISDIYYLLTITTIILFFNITFYKEIKTILFNREFAKAIGIHSTIFYYFLIYFIGFVVGGLLKTVGGVLLYALIVNPASSAYQITYNLKKMYILSILFGIISTLSGLILSAIFNTPTGASIVIVSSFIFSICFLFSPKRKIKNE